MILCLPLAFAQSDDARQVSATFWPHMNRTRCNLSKMEKENNAIVLEGCRPQILFETKKSHKDKTL